MHRFVCFRCSPGSETAVEGAGAKVTGHIFFGKIQILGIISERVKNGPKTGVLDLK